MASNIEVIRNVEEEAFDAEPPSYDEAFPALTISSDIQPHMPQEPRSWKPIMFCQSKCTQVFTVPLEERKFTEINDQGFGEETEQAKICKDIMSRNGVVIEMSLAKDRSLTVVISGKADAVMKSRREVVNGLQTQAVHQLNIPREHHRFILGTKAMRLHELELNTTTSISVPRPEANSETLRIVGTKENIEKAVHELQCISDEQAKLAFERLPVPKIYHPFVCGPYNRIIKTLMEETGVKINVPPTSVQKDEIVVSGEKDGVNKCKAIIMRTYEERKRRCQTVSVEVKKSQHKYVIGPRGTCIQDILAETGVSVDVPSWESTSETITLRGNQDKLGPALTMVYSKANSVIFAEVSAPAWLHRFIIGRKGEKVKKITQNYSKVHIEFTEGQDKIQLEGPPEEVTECVKDLEELVRDLQSRMDFAEIQIDQKFHKHIIGKNGQNITRIKNETGVAIRIPADSEKSNIIRIEGDPDGVVKAKEELIEMATRMENEKSRDVILEQRFHRNIIGAKGERIREIRDMFNQVQVTFPDPGKKSDVVAVRGPKSDVDKCHHYLQQLHCEMIANNFQSKVHIFKDFHKNIIGKGGNTIRKIREETDTRIDLPSENIESDIITITGKKANVELARQKIETIQKELGNIKELTIEIPHKLHNSIIGAKGRLIKAIMEECGGVIIRFPAEGSSDDKVIIRGPKEDAESARKQLLELATEKQQSSFTAEVRAKPEYHKFLIGRGGANIRKVREKTGARVIFPSQQDTDQETISIIGTKESVELARIEITDLVQNLENIVEAIINVDPKHHRHFVARRGEVLRHIAEEYGGVTVSFPRSGVKSDKVVLKGSRDCVEGAKRRIQELVADLDLQVVVECIIPQHYHRTVMGAKGSNVQEITRVNEVGIKFPDRPIANGGTKTEGEEDLPNGDVEPPEDDGSPKKTDIIVITGKPENCEKAKDALMALVPITDEMAIPYDFHRFIIGQKGRDVRRMMEDFDVNISIPSADEHSEAVKISGPPANVERAKHALGERCEQLQKEKEDRMLKAFHLTIEVQAMHHPKIIGRRGAVITKIRQNHEVNIQFAPKGEIDNPNAIVITGYENNCEAARDEILKIVKNLEEMVTIECRVDYRVHPRIIGQKGRAIRKLMEQYKVDVRFPRPDTDDDPNLIFITGEEEDCEDCKDTLLNIEEEYLQDIIDQEYLQTLQQPPSRSDDVPYKPGNPRGFVVRNAPWDAAPDTANTDEFPSFGAVVAPNPTKAWGPFRKK